MSPPNPNHIDEEVEMPSGTHILMFTNSAMSIGRDRDDPSEGVWLNNFEKQILYKTLHDHFDGQDPDGLYANQQSDTSSRSRDRHAGQRRS